MDMEQGIFRKLFDLSGKVALITGAGVGFGEAIALGFAEFGCDVAASDLNLENPQRTAERVRQAGRRAIALKANVAVPDDVTAMVQTTVRELGGIDILVNCAGIPQHDPAELTPVETWDRVLNINLRGTFLCCQAAARVMLEKGHGVMINFSSIAGVVGVGRGANAYCASKGGVNALTKQLALEWADRGIRVNAIAPCQFMTPGLQGSDGQAAIRTGQVDAGLEVQYSPGSRRRTGRDRRARIISRVAGFLHGHGSDSSGGRRLSGSITKGKTGNYL